MAGGEAELLERTDELALIDASLGDRKLDITPLGSFLGPSAHHDTETSGSNPDAKAFNRPDHCRTATRKDEQMLFHVTSEFVGVSEDSERRHFTVFNQWQPPAELEFKAFYNFADNSGGVAIVEFDDAATLARTTATWMPWLRFRTTPIEPVPNMIAIRGEAIAFRDSVRSRAPLAGRGLLTRKGLGRRSEGGPGRLSGPRPSRRSRRARRR